METTATVGRVGFSQRGETALTFQDFDVLSIDLKAGVLRFERSHPNGKSVTEQLLSSIENLGLTVKGLTLRR